MLKNVLAPAYQRNRSCPPMWPKKNKSLPPLVRFIENSLCHLILVFSKFSTWNMTFWYAGAKISPHITPEKKFLAPFANMPGQGRRPCPGILARGQGIFFLGWYGGEIFAPAYQKVTLHVENLKNTNIVWHKGFLINLTKGGKDLFFLYHVGGQD